MMKGFLYIVFLALVVSCNSDDVCLKSTANPLQIGMYSYVLDTLGNAKKVEVQVQAITVQLLNQSLDTFIDKNPNQFKFYVPLNPASTKTAFVMWVDSAQGSPDTVYVEYSVQEVFLDLACGIAYEYTIDTSYGNRFRIDSIIIPNSKIKLNNTDENIQLIF